MVGMRRLAATAAIKENLRNIGISSWFRVKSAVWGRHSFRPYGETTARGHQWFKTFVCDRGELVTVRRGREASASHFATRNDRMFDARGQLKPFRVALRLHHCRYPPAHPATFRRHPRASGRTCRQRRKRRSPERLRADAAYTVAPRRQG